ncbi:MAG: DUF58 domain-containing protein [Armatimonadetes bacterium]|nr:DUF58 domain-containing protein [Armatimonadota bacterium]
MNRFHAGNSIVVRFMRAVYRDHLTSTGRAVFWLFLLANASGMMSFIVKVYFVWCLLLSLSLGSIVLARLARVPLVIEADFPARTTCGATVQVPLTVTNRSRRKAVDVELAPWQLPDPLVLEPEYGVYLDELGPGESRRLSWQIDFRRRGHFTIPGVRQATLFPFGLWRDRLIHRQARSLLVYPRFQPLLSLDIPVGRRYQPGGIALTSNLGDSTEFLSTREFRDGDSLRMIHWRSWARLGKPIVKEFQEEYFCRIALLLDTFLPRKSDARDVAAFEASVSISAAVADSLARSEYVIDIFAAGPEIYHLQAGRSLAYLENVMDILACIEPSYDPPFETITPVLLDYLENITTTVVVLQDWDEQRERMLQTIRDRGSEVKAILVRDKPPTQDFSAAGVLASGGLVHLTSGQVNAGVEDL